MGAAFQAPLPAWSASMVQEPGVTKVSAPPAVMVHTPPVDDVNVTGSPDVEVALSVGVVPKFCAPGLPNVIVWLPLGVTALDAADDTLVPTALVAVTVKVYEVPLVNPVTTAVQAAGPAQLPKAPPGLAVAV